ncbi:MAG: glycosyltransferase family 1 protein [Patescibacteria group bacterium]
MRIGIDCRTILNPGKGEQAGVGHYTYYLIKNLLKNDKKNQYVLFFDYRVTKTREFKQKNVEVKYFPFSEYKKFLPFSYSHMLISAFISRAKLDIYHSPANVIPYTYSGPSVITVHDLAIYKHPEWFPRGQKFSTRLLVPKSLHKAKRIIAVSQATKKDIIKLFKIPAHKIDVIYEGVFREKPKVGFQAVKKKHGLADDYILFLGTIEPRKNLIGLVHAYAELIKNKRFSKYQLVIAGAKGWKEGEVFKTIRKMKLEDRVLYLGYVAHQDKLSLISNAKVFIFPSYYEGFGLPILEAMELGAPVITSNVSSIPEVTNHSAVHINPTKEKEIVQALAKVLGSAVVRRKLRAAGINKAKQFSWQKCAQQTGAVYRKVYQEIKREAKAKEARKKKSKQPKKKK